MIDITKQYKTRDGRAVRIVWVDGPGIYPVIGFIERLSNTFSWAASGRYGSDPNFNLIEVKPRIRVERWVNVSIRGSVFAYSSEGDAIDSAAHPYPSEYIIVAQHHVWEGEG
jgi:hypothetical protein